MPVELAGISLTYLNRIGTDETTRVVRHPVPGMAGDVSQALGRSSAEVELAGVFCGPAAADELEQLRQAHEAGEPVSFFVQAVDDSEAVQTLHFSEVLIRALQTEQRAGAPDEFVYRCRLVEHVPPPAPAAADMLGPLDTDLVASATASIDGVQDALEGVSQLTGLLAATPSFADPTTRLPAMLDAFAPVARAGAGLLGEIRDQFDAPE